MNPFYAGDFESTSKGFIVNNVIGTEGPNININITLGAILLIIAALGFLILKLRSKRANNKGS